MTDRPWWTARPVIVAPTGPKPTTSRSTTSSVNGSRAESGPARTELGEIGGHDEFRRKVGSPGVGRVLQAQRRAVAYPCGVVRDAVEIRIQLEERTGRVPQVPVEVGAGEVPTDAPGMAVRVTSVERGRGVAHVVEVVALPGVVLQDRHRRVHEPDVVMIGGAAQEVDEPVDLVADLASDAVDEKVTGRA